MAAGRRIPITVEADTDGDFDKAARSLGDVETSATRAERSLDGLSRGHRALDAEINRVGKSVRDVRAEFERTGDVGLLGDARKLESTEKRLRAFRRELDGAAESAPLLARALDAVSGAGLPGFRGISSDLVTGLAAAAAVAAPAIGAAISAGVLLGVGGAGIVGGLALAAQDTRVITAYTDLGNYVKEQLTVAASGFVDPAIRSAGKLKAAFDDIAPDIAADFNLLSPSIDKLADGVSGLVTRTMPGLNEAFAASVPVVNALADELPAMGAATSEFFSSIAAGGPGAVTLIHDLATALDVTIISTGKFIEVLSKAYEFLRHGPGELFTGPLMFALDALEGKSGKVHSSFQMLDQSTGLVGDAFVGLSAKARDVGLNVDLAAADFGIYSAAISAARSDTDSLAASMVDKMLSATLGLDQATLGFAQSQTSLGEVLKANHTNIDISSAKGQQLREAVLGVVGANQREYDSMIKAGSSAQEAAGAYDNNTAALERQLQKAGLTQRQIDGLIGKYRGVPANVDTDIAMHGLAEAIHSLDDAIRLANHLDGRRVDVTIATLVQTTHKDVYIGGASPYTQSASAFGANAKGGIVAAEKGMITSSPTILFGERQTGAEAYIPKLGITGQRAGQLLGTAAGWHGYDVVPRGRSGYASPMMPGGGAGGGQAGGGTTLQAEWVGGSSDPLIAALITHLRLRVRNDGAGNVQTLLGARS